MTCTTEKTYTYAEISDAVNELVNHLETVCGRDYALGYIKACYAGALSWPTVDDATYLMRRLEEWREEANRVKTHWDIMAEVYEKESVL